MSAIPNKSSFTGASVTEGQFKAAFEQLHDYLTELLGSAGRLALGHGQCRLARDSATQLRLSPRKGNRVMVKDGSGWSLRTLGSAGITVDTTGLSADTTYYCYLYDSGGTLTLELVVTGHATDSDTGVEIKSGDATRTLVGMARTNASTQFPDSPTMVRSWYQRERVSESGAYSADRSTASGSYVELNTEIRVEFLCWSGEAVQAALAGRASNTVAGQSMALVFGLDGTVAGAQTAGNFGAATQSVALAAEMEPSEGYHYLTLLAAVTGGTGTVSGAANFNSASAIRSTLHVALG